MAVGAAIAVGLIVGALIVAAIVSTMDQDDQDKATLDDFSTTQCREGSVVPIVFGKVKIAGNILWWGQIASKKVKTDPPTLLGFRVGDSVTTGYKYYLDIWTAICIGPITLHSAYIKDDPKSLASLWAKCKNGHETNDGTETTTPKTRMEAKGGSFPYVTKLPGVAWTYFDKFYLGENVTNVPTVAFVVSKVSTAPVNHADMSNGTNPAAVIYELLVLGGALYGDFDIASFNDAADYWYSKGYALNLAISRQEKVQDQVKKIFTYVDGCLTVDGDDKFVLTAYKDSGETPVTTIDTEKFLSFQFTRKDWSETSNYFKGAYVDEDQDFTKRNVVCNNPANIRLLGYKKTMSVSLGAFRDADTASQRLWEIMKAQSYPAASIKCTVDLEYSEVREGQLVTINNTEYDISNADYRVIDKDLSGIESNEIKFTLAQYIHGLFDDAYQAGGDAQGVVPDTTPAQLAYRDAFEMPFMGTTHEPTWLMLGARQGTESFMDLLVSTDGGTSYEQFRRITNFAQRGLLDAIYPITHEIDDGEDGILYTPYREDPDFETISRANLFFYGRFIVIDDEVMAFETVTPVGETQFRLTGIVRGLFNTAIVSHSDASPIWITDVEDNLISGISATSFHVKMIPGFGDEQVDASGASAKACTLTNKAATPWPPTRIQAVRSGSSVTFTWWPTTQDNVGGGLLPGDGQVDSYPFPFDGDFWFDASEGSHEQFVSNTTLGITQSGAFTAYLKSRRVGFLSSQISLSVGAGDGTYTGPNA